MKSVLLWIVLVASVSAQYPELPTIQDLRKDRPEDVREASKDVLAYLRNPRDSKLFDAYAQTWLQDKAPVGFVCLEQQLLIQKRLQKGFFFGNKLLSYAIRKSPTYGRPFLIRLLTNKTFPRHEVAVFFMEIRRAGYSTYWFPKSRWYALLEDYVMDTELCVKEESVTPGRMVIVDDGNGAKMEREADTWKSRKVYRYEAAYHLLPADLKTPGVDIEKVDVKTVRDKLKPTIDKIKKERLLIQKRNATWAKVLDYRKTKTKPASLKALLTQWNDVIERPKRLYLSDLQYLTYLLVREVQAAEVGDKDAAAGVDVIMTEVTSALNLTGISSKAPTKAQKTSVGEIRLWLQPQLQAIAKKTISMPIKFEMDGFWQWVKDLDPAKVDESTMLSQKAEPSK